MSAGAHGGPVHVSEALSAIVGYALAATALPAGWAYGQALQARRDTIAAGEQVAPSDDALLLVLETVQRLGEQARAYRAALQCELQPAPEPSSDPRDPNGPIPDGWA